ncbi:hypothetical protein C5952_03155 [Cronobacter sakazakii]|uniref:hypothetical protein n=1 Tax=Cronobacter TaxID=413496 RepID=UPI000A11652B|nr:MULTISPECIES: hypothetical protein [Cronobacter]ELQ6277123.1 hypothetical protein [Cronobacter sakazakii]ELY4319892.1 hypothetical protein [Cronobacter sakazakii]ELY6363411.1 hypothetical protein [Cronobacter sakazakii]NCH03634.1 hypothetical protein [Cronobacter malonaticus]NCH52985.1 hypothetical protein [Cronobacter malonaticus]
MKEEIQKAVIELISKSAVEIDDADRQTIVDEAIRTALEHIAETVNTVQLAKSSPYMNIWVRFGMSPELPSVGQKRAAMVAFTRRNPEGMKDVRVGAWYNGRIIFTNSIMCRPEEELENFINLTIKSLARRADVEDDAACAAFVSIMEQDGLKVRTTDLITPSGILDLVASGETNIAIARIREMEYGTICDMCRSDLDLVRIVVDAGQACDGVIASFSSMIARVANDLPMIKQEAKSYAVHHANELLAPYRSEAAQDKMTGWATW